MYCVCVFIGPLVSACLRAAKRAGMREKVKVYAVEKNGNAVITLRNRVMEEELWGSDRVEVVHCDMRDWQGPGYLHPLRNSTTPVDACTFKNGTGTVDLIVSELLGSLGDNECSPECLDCVLHLLRPDTGVCIPQSYTSYLAPISTPKLWMAARDHSISPSSGSFSTGLGGGVSGLDVPYVVHLNSFLALAQPKPLFTFAHNPNTSKSKSNDTLAQPHTNARSRTLSFVLNGLGADTGATGAEAREAVELDPQKPSTVLLSGFAGYFETVLYKQICLSTLPQPPSSPSALLSSSCEPVSVGMFSWFPMFFPLATQMLVSCSNCDSYTRDEDSDFNSDNMKGENHSPASTVAVSVWRRTTPQRVWYEWAIAKPVAGQVQNAKGKSFSIGL